MAAEQTVTGVMPEHLHALDVRAVNAVAIGANEIDAGNALPLHVRAVEIEASRLAESGLIDRGQVLAGAGNVTHRPFAGMALEIEGRAVFQARLEHRREAFDQQFKADVEHVWNGMSAQRGWHGRKQEPMAPTMGWGTDKP